MLVPASPPAVFEPAAEPAAAHDAPCTVAEALVSMLEALGVRHAFGISGGAVASLWTALANSSIATVHFRHEAGAVFSAMEAYFATGRPVVVFGTTGPGITNLLTGMHAAWWEGAKLIVLTPATSPSHRGRWAFQESSPFTMSPAGLSAPGAPCHYACCVEEASQLPEVARRLSAGLQRPNGYVASVQVPPSLQASRTTRAGVLSAVRRLEGTHLPGPSRQAVSAAAAALQEGPFAVWVGFGARHASEQIRQLVDRTGARVMCSPRGKGIFPEDDPRFVGVTGFGGHDTVLEYMRAHRPLRTLVLGSRLGEFTSFWQVGLVPEKGFVHVDIDPDVPRGAYPWAPTTVVQSDIGLFLDALLPELSGPASGGRARPASPPARPPLDGGAGSPAGAGRVPPEAVLAAIQRHAIDGADAVVLTEAGNSFAWGTHALRFRRAGRYRVSTGFGSMGHAATGVVGAAMARGGKALALVGDGAMLMNSELSTAARHRIPAVWVVLNDGCYNMCRQGNELRGFQPADTEVGHTDFVMIARGMGAGGRRVTREEDLDAAFAAAMAAAGPFVIDVLIDRDRIAPIGARIGTLSTEDASRSSSVVAPPRERPSSGPFS